MRRRYHFGLLGHNIAYSKSPSIFGTLADIRRVDIEFDVVDISPTALDATMERLKALDGFSVTIPFKKILAPYMDDLSDEARIIGAVNSVKVENGKMSGHNTDGVGFMAPLRETGFGGKKILVLGAGGAARAVIFALKKEYPQSEFTVCGRDGERIRRLVNDIGERYAIGKRLRGLTFDQLDSSEGYDLIVNCTPVGGTDYRKECVLPDSKAVRYAMIWCMSPSKRFF